MVACGFSDENGIAGSNRLVAYGPTLTVDIGFDPNFIIGSNVPNLAAVGVPALVDTGATQSFIDDDLAKTLNLPIVDRQKFGGISGEHEANVYLAQIHVPAFPFTIYGPFGGVNLAAGGQTHRALIGRTFLMHFQLTYNGKTGAVEIVSIP